MVKFRNDPSGQFLCKSPLTKATALKLAYWEIWVGGASVPRRNKVEVNMEPLHATLPLAAENNTSSATDSVKLNKVKHGASTWVPKGTNFKAVICSGQHCALLSALAWTLEVTVPKLSSYFQVSVSNAREISLKYGLSLSKVSVGWVGLSFRAPDIHCQTLFSLYSEQNQSYHCQYGMTSPDSKKLWHAGEKWYVIVSCVYIILNMPSLAIIHSWLWLINPFKMRSGQFPHTNENFKEKDLHLINNSKAPMNSIEHCCLKSCPWKLSKPKY